MTIQTSPVRRNSDAWPNGPCYFSGRIPISDLYRVTNVDYCSNSNVTRGRLSMHPDEWIIAEGKENVKIMPSQDCTGCPFYDWKPKGA